MCYGLNCQDIGSCKLFGAAIVPAILLANALALKLTIIRRVETLKRIAIGELRL